MARRQYNIHQAKTHLSHLVEMAAGGDEVVIARNGRPIAKLVPYTRDDTPRQPGGWEGKVSIAADFDDWTPELDAAFYGDRRDA